MSLWECFLIRTLITLTIFLNAISIPAIVIERAIGTYFASKYEKIGKKVGFTLVIAQIIIASGSFFTVLRDEPLSTKKVPYCSSVNSEERSLKHISLSLKTVSITIRMNIAGIYQRKKNI
ncbi:unnamed protein product [Thelazia callipaeda]|uniref:Solute carrier family 40 protein n=1 Tax=Thelazia callipaeda TaxID=103827 RepID=A0A0N5DCJ5_THECL|nr:unnamed protein product [Thelazia callipaeda]